MELETKAVAECLAENIVSLRKKRKLTQLGLAKLSGATRPSIALLESGSANPTLEVLMKISQALQVSIDELTSPSRAECVHIPAKEIPVDKRSKRGVVLRKLLPDKIRATEMDELTLEVGAKMIGSPHVDGTKEYFTCVEGKISIGVLGQIYQLSAGDVLAFPGDQPHAYRNSGRKKARGIGVVFFNPNPLPVVKT